MMTQAQREAAYERVRRELGIDRVGTAPEAPVLRSRQGGVPARPAYALPVEAEIHGAQLYEYEIWGRPGLDLRTRSFITVAVLTALGREDQLYRYVNSALNIGITPEEIHETLLHAGVYSGLPAWENAAGVAGEVFVARGLVPAGSGAPVEPKPAMDHEERRAARNRVVAALGVGRIGLGPDAPLLEPLPGSPFPAAKPGRLAFEQELAGITADYGYGEVWGRPGLDLRTRSFITVSVLQVQYQNDQLHIHVNNALNLGITPEAVGEAITQAGIYDGGSGWHNAMNVARHVFLQHGIAEGD
ncbi:carboxymuconolactone decarboxylase family protein [Parafrankia sp. BMG5.11]|uniref:carboxymuconolactone decarboxylase family protein n=1 Tax=Parafrankia sp. BMG5.11 TaxID=222540 RepID=UPI001039CF46|nr:carboxymuconolactone decarboxylase family protein [Parafrankia sp. BMG5.11]TCJ37764.1 carboxymuconolactone decarboxylase [Parafrankia sp. BMG5.11]